MYANVKVKIFKFEVSNSASAAFESDLKERWFHSAKAKLSNPFEIQSVINTWIASEGALVINIDVKSVDVQYHNNARGNTVQLWYTITYCKEEI